MGKFLVTPVNELQTREWFAFHLSEFDYDIVESQTGFPDLVLSDGTRAIRAEAEYESANFVAHRHDASQCDLVVCWVHNYNLPLPVLELSTRTMHVVGMGASVDAEVEAWRSEATGKKKKRERKEQERLARTLEKCPTELRKFMAAFVADLDAQSEYQRNMTEPRLALLRAQQVLVSAICSRGGRTLFEDGRGPHPEDLFRMISASGVTIDL